MYWRFYAVQGPFGSGKTASAVRMAVKRSGKNTHIYTNIRMSNLIPNVHFQEPMDLFKVFSEILNRREREDTLFRKEKPNGLFAYERNKYTKNLVIIDEAGIVVNNRNHKEFDMDLVAFINQIRKLNTEVYLVSADGSQIDKNLRRFVDKYYEFEPIPWIGWLFPFDLFRCRYYSFRDEDGNLIRKEKVKSDGSVIRIPQRFFDGIVYMAGAWKSYDDLSLNIPAEIRSRVKKTNPFRKVFWLEDTPAKKPWKRLPRA